jgi:hypothetical protein
MGRLVVPKSEIPKRDPLSRKRSAEKGYERGRE